jgi:hypothetical protein
MSIKSRLTRVEKAAGIGELCLTCKHELVLFSDLIRHTKPDDLLVFSCRECGFPRHVVLDGYSKRERSLIGELLLTDRSERRTLEERKRFYALQIYIYVLPRTREVREIGENEEKRLRETIPPTISSRQQVKLLDEWKGAQAQIESVRRQKRTEEEDIERESRRAVSAPTMTILQSVKAENLEDADLHHFKVMAGLEVIIFGATLPETQDKIESREAQLQAEKEAREREERERKERLERERQEREERYRQQREQQEREFAERREREAQERLIQPYY